MLRKDRKEAVGSHNALQDTVMINTTFISKVVNSTNVSMVT